MFEKLTNEQLQALREYAKEHGRKWKDDLHYEWMNASAPSTLHRLRNTHGPAWLVGFRIK